MKRLTSIDIARGIVMIIMALDHIRDMMGIGMLQDPTNLATTTPALFFTRWITHLCAPTFVFLSGVSAWLLVQQSGINEGRTFLIRRGLWLIFLELTVINFGLWFDPWFHSMIFEVIGAIGFGFIILALCLNASAKTLGIAGLVIIFGHNLFSLVSFEDGSLMSSILSPLFMRTFYPISPDFLFVNGYPPIPWLGIMLAGFGLGKIFTYPAHQRKSVFLRLGIASCILFLGIRFINVYGDISWSGQKNAMFTFLSFMNVTKYPPSLLFVLSTLGVLFLLLAFLEGVKNKWTDAVMVYGKVPLFYFIIHLYLIHLLMFAMLFMQGFGWKDLNFGIFTMGKPAVENGLPLWGIYIVWIGVVLSLYPLCKIYGDYKSNNKEKTWLRYL